MLFHDNDNADSHCTELQQYYVDFFENSLAKTN